VESPFVFLSRGCGAEGIMTKMAGSPVHATIDHATVDFRIVPVLQCIAQRDGA